MILFRYLEDGAVFQFSLILHFGVVDDVIRVIGIELAMMLS